MRLACILSLLATAAAAGETLVREVLYPGATALHLPRFDKGYLLSIRATAVT
jgi:hypothetical protein